MKKAIDALLFPRSSVLLWPPGPHHGVRIWNRRISICVTRVLQDGAHVPSSKYCMAAIPAQYQRYERVR